MFCVFHDWKRTGTSYEKDYDHIWDSEGYVSQTKKIFTCQKCSKTKTESVIGYEECPLHTAKLERKRQKQQEKHYQSYLGRREKRLLKSQLGIQV